VCNNSRQGGATLRSVAVISTRTALRMDGRTAATSRKGRYWLSPPPPAAPCRRVDPRFGTKSLEAGGTTEARWGPAVLAQRYLRCPRFPHYTGRANDIRSS
jgi:hypothetical protein